jgi:hypothetical protein
MRIEVRGGSPAEHRLYTGMALAILGAWVAARRATGFAGVPGAPRQFLAVPLFDVTQSALFVALAIGLLG